MVNDFSQINCNSLASRACSSLGFSLGYRYAMPSWHKRLSSDSSSFWFFPNNCWFSEGSLGSKGYPNVHCLLSFVVCSNKKSRSLTAFFNSFISSIWWSISPCSSTASLLSNVLLSMALRRRWVLKSLLDRKLTGLRNTRRSLFSISLLNLKRLRSLIDTPM